MPLIDVSRVLNSPMLVDSFTVNRRTQTVGDNGRGTISNQASTVSGVVYPSDENDLERFSDLEITSKALTVITRFALRGESEVAGTDFSPDIVVWPLPGGDNYLVRKIEDWSRYGTGFIKAICTAIDTVNQPPTTE